MKSIAWNRVILVLGILGLIIYLLVSLLSKQNDVVCKRIDVKINNEGKLVYPKDISDIIEKSRITGVGKLLDDRKLGEVKELLETKGYLRDITVYKTSNSVLHVELKQRIPVMCILNEDGESCYLDDEGYVLKRSFRHTYNVPLVTGKIQVPRRGKMTADSVFVCNLLKFAGFVANHSFWNAQIQQINVDKQKNIELTLCSDDFCIRLGQLADYEEKMDNLYAFCKKVNPSKRGQYKILDLRFNKQIVAVKKELKL